MISLDFRFGSDFSIVSLAFDTIWFVLCRRFFLKVGFFMYYLLPNGFDIIFIMLT